ncbi:hypothetical protein CQW23_06468 [Capsicum baccatum]|uniref:NB-ARC domain-containing protein n=1 Tax=Capsicum baccatum TaxID=33114 RepID=A0A2G2X3C7_CAPBA|nr:hypothetical protein CQW23_06468 [Capsicum baccatum]
MMVAHNRTLLKERKAKQLETLNFTDSLSGRLPERAKAFPATLKKLKLERTFLSWSYMDVIAELPNLEVLKLMDFACVGEGWHPNLLGHNRIGQKREYNMPHASVASLISLLTSNSPMRSLIPNQELCSLREKASSLKIFVKNFEKNNVFGEMTDFEVESRKILQKLAKDIDHVWKDSTKVQDKGKQVSKESLFHGFSSSTNDILNVNNNMVGCDDQKERLLEDLTGSYSGEPKVMPIVGIGGIGKTTLAKEVYNHESILRRFDVRAWATVSHQHNIKEILLSLLQSTIKVDDTVKTKGEAELADMLQKSLKRKRYLIVLDDVDTQFLLSVPKINIFRLPDR